MSGDMLPESPVPPAASGVPLSAGRPRRPARWLRHVALHGLLAGLWLATYICARLLEYAPHASLWFPPAAVTFAGVMVFGWRAIPALVAACLVATVLAYEQPPPAGQLLASGLAFALAHCGAFGLLAAMLRRSLQRPDAAGSLLRPVTVFLLGGSAAALLAAVGGAAGLALTGMIEAADVGPLIVPWMIGDYAGLVSLAPLLAVLMHAVSTGFGLPRTLPRISPALPDHGHRQHSPPWPKLAVLLGLTAGVLIAGSLVPDQRPVLFTLFLAVVVQMWIVHSQPALHALCSIALFSLTLVLLTPALGLGEHALMLQFAMIALAANSYFGLAVPELYADNARLRQLTMHDPLTGALSRAWFIELVRTGMQRAGDVRAPVALVMIDLDELKHINDVHGHAAGDQALQQLVEHCRGQLGSEQFIGRLSGDEFCVFLPGAAAADAMRCVARMREAIDRMPQDRLPHRVTASFGIAVADAGDESYESLVSRADQAMYQAKRAARSAGDGSDSTRRFR